MAWFGTAKCGMSARGLTDALLAYSRYSKVAVAMIEAAESKCEELGGAAASQSCPSGASALGRQLATVRQASG